MISYAIIINTCDKFEDCWVPFFKLFKKYWPQYTSKIYLNTETKTFTYPGLNIISVQNNLQTPEQRLTWSECLIRALNTTPTDIVLYMQEDYFLKDNVKNDLVEKYVQMMQEHTNIDCIHLTDQGLLNHKKSEKYDGLYAVLPKQRYLVSCQAALWKKETLLKLLRNYENAWQFEEFGSQRAAILKPEIYGVDKNWVKLNQFEIIPYIFTGIVQGRWYEPVVDLFKKHDIEIDFKIRGFLKDKPKRSLRVKLLYQWHRIPFLFKHWVDLRNIR